ncbi:MAG: MFS transporter, partial [Dehalococcoidia bacterium]|nr:MFS transporter [Dehalococcoidia bacterium]
RGLAMGIVTSSVGIGMVVMAPVAAYLIVGYGWRTSYLVMSFIAFIGIIPLAFLLKRAPAEVALRKREQQPEKTPDTATRDYTLRQALGHRNLWLLMGMWFVCAGCLGLIATHIVPHAMDTGITATRASLIMSILGAMSVAGKLGLGRASDNMGRKRALIIAGAIMTVSMAWLLGASNLWMLYLFAVIYGFAYGGYASPSTALIGDTFGIRHLGLIMAVIDAGWGIGSAVGPALAGYLFDISGGYTSAFIAALIGALLSMLLAMFLRQPQPRVVILSKEQR